MLTEKDYCDYDTCVALKELGFREKCSTYYDTEDNVGLLYNTQWAFDNVPYQFTDCLESHNSNTSDDNSYVDAPTMWEAQKWLREEKQIEIVVHSFDYVGEPYFADIHMYREVRCACSYADSYEEALSEGLRQAIKILKEN